MLLFLAVLSGVPGSSLLALRPLRMLGSISFGVYLFHGPLLIVAERLGLTGLVAFAFVLCVSIAAASLSLWLYERPVQASLRRWLVPGAREGGNLPSSGGKMSGPAPVSAVAGTKG